MSTSLTKEVIQNDWEFYNDIDEYMKSDPSVHEPITSDCIRGVKHKIQDNLSDDKNDHNESEEQKSKQIGGGKENIIEEFQSLVKEQTATIIETMDCQHIHTTEIQQKQHDEQMEIFKQFLLKF
ncbi:hypothetical protein C1645_820365 [Glomus cerebriforme]|uniref:Uncharacterized protein n=1 Tax=Glomus cerebriforme TaxID=658196 RepID=A0A397T4E1_9GLOM|nr:hypothetical protein C1645_820365 [Glomus cerebriforme]